MSTIKFLVNFLERLEELRIFYHLNKVRDSILVEIAVPGQRWEVEFMSDGKIEIEKFISGGVIYDSNELEVLFKDFAD